LRPEDAVACFAGWKVPWWVAGGWAIDLRVGHQTRPHNDFDVLVLRRDLDLIRATLAEWDLWAADPPGRLRIWPVGEVLALSVHDVWCRKAPTSPWSFQLMIDDTDGEDWLFRRDHRIRRAVTSLTARGSMGGAAVLTPEVQLLYKSNDVREKDAADFRAVRPLLTPEECEWLKTSLEIVAPGHGWIPEL